MSDIKKSILSNLIWKYLERTFAQVVSAIVSIVLARILAPEAYGLIAMINVFITIADVFVNNGLGQALIQKMDSDELDFSSTFFSNFILSLIIYLLLFLGAPYISNFYNADILTPIIRVMGLRVILASFNSIQQAYISKQMEFKKLFYSTSWGTILSGLVGIVMAYQEYGVWALVWQYMSNSLVNTILLYFTSGWKVQLRFSITRVKHLFAYGWKILFESLSETIVNQLRNLIIGRVYSSSDLAYYTKGQQFPDLIMNNLGTTVSAVLFPAMSSMNDRKEGIHQTLRLSVNMLSYILFPLLGVLAVIAEPLIQVLLTDKWLAAAPFMKIYSLNMIITVGLYPRHQALKAIGKSEVYMLEHIPCRIINIILLLITLNSGPMLIMISGTLATLIVYIVTIYTSKKYNGYRLCEQFSDIKNSVILLLIIWLGTKPFLMLRINDIYIAILQILFSLAIFVILSIVLNMEEWKVLQKCIKSICKK